MWFSIASTIFLSYKIDVQSCTKMAPIVPSESINESSYKAPEKNSEIE